MRPRTKVRGQGMLLYILMGSILSPLRSARRRPPSVERLAVLPLGGHTGSCVQEQSHGLPWDFADWRAYRSSRCSPLQCDGVQWYGGYVWPPSRLQNRHVPFQSVSSGSRGRLGIGMPEPAQKCVTSGEGSQNLTLNAEPHSGKNHLGAGNIKGIQSRQKYEVV